MAEGVVRDGKALMFDANGRRVSVPMASLDQALAAGFQYESPDSVAAYDQRQEAQTLGGMAKAAGEAALRGATVGLSDVALTSALGDDYREAALARQQANPFLSTGFEVAGALAPMLASGGSSAAARGLAGLGAPARGVAALGRGTEAATAAALRAFGATGETALGRIGARALGMGTAGAVEGGAYGMGQAISDAALGGTDITAEKLLAAAEDGALFGGLTGGLLGGGGQAVGEAGKKVLGAMTGGKTLGQAARDFAERRAVKAVTGNYKKAYDELTRFGKNPERLNRVGKKLLDSGINVDDLDDAVRGLGEQVEGAATQMKAIASELDGAGVKVDARKLIDRWDEQIKKLRDVDLDDYQKVAGELEKKIAPLRKRVDGAGNLGAMKVTRGPDGKRVLTPSKGDAEIGFSDFWKLRQNFDETVRWNQRNQTLSADELREMRRIFDDSLTEAVEGADDAVKALAAGGDDAARKALESGETAAGRWKAAKEDYHDFITLKDAADELKTNREKNRFFSPSDQGVGGLFGIGAMQALVASGGAALPSLLASAGVGLVANAAHKFLRERGSAMIARAANQLAKMEGEITHSARVIAGLEKAKRAVTPVAMGAKKLGERFDKMSEEVQALNSQPARMTTRLATVTGEMDGDLPELGVAVRQRVIADYQYLAAQMPRPLGRAGSTLTPNAVKPVYSPSDQKAWLAKAEALDKPMTVVKKLEQGIIDRDGIEALKARRPELYQALRVRVAEACAERDTELEPGSRVMLSLAFDINGDPSMRPEVIREIQASYQGTPAEQEGAAKRPGPAPRSFDSDSPKDLVLPSQKMAMGA